MLQEKARSAARRAVVDRSKFPDPANGLRIDPRCEQAAAYLWIHFRRRPSMAEVAAEVGMSSDALSSLFLAHFRTTPALYLDRLSRGAAAAAFRPESKAKAA